MKEERKPIRSFYDLEVYQETYKACILVMTQILPRLPKEEQYDLVDQLRRSAKAIPPFDCRRLFKKASGKRVSKVS
jgi:hypothetical protein